MQTDRFGIPIELSNQLDKVSVKDKIYSLTERYRAGEFSFSELRRLSDRILSEGKIKDMLIDAELVPELIVLSPDDSKEFQLKEKKNVLTRTKKRRSI